MSGFFVWGHRGASSQAPENTMAAFHEAYEAGAGGVELDVHLSRDGVPVVIHDETLDRTTSGAGPVKNKTFSQIRALDAGGWFSSDYSGERVPSLEDVLRWAQGRLRLNIEIKAADAGMAVLELLSRHPLAEVLLSSFNHHLLARLRRLAPDLPMGFLVDGPFWHLALVRAVRHGGVSVHPRADRVSRTLVRACHSKGLHVIPWTVDELERIDFLRRLGVDGVFTNDPRKVLRHLDEPD